MNMTPPVDPWNSLEVAKLVIGVLTPLTVALVGLFISRRLKQLDLLLWTNQKLIEKRLAVYDMVAPQLNKLLCFFTWIGYWKEVSPSDVIQAKRELDKAFNVYRYLFDVEVYRAYQVFVHELFETHTGAGADARIRSVVSGPDGDRQHHTSYIWQSVWNDRFAQPAHASSKQDIRTAYKALMSTLTHSFNAASRKA